MRVCLVASSRYPICEPFAGGLESMTHLLAGELARRGHEVTLFAAPGTDPNLAVRRLPPAEFAASPVALSDRNAPSGLWMAEHHAYLALMLELARDGGDHYDLVHNNSLHHLPVAMASALSLPVLTTLHTPPLPWLESAVTLSPGTSSFAAVSASMARAWAPTVRATPVLNGVDLDRWRPGPGGGDAVWSGRLVAEKAPHLAMDACRRAGVRLQLAGPVHDVDYFEREVRPRLGDGIEHVGHLAHGSLARLLAEASVAVVSPVWDEPYGLVAAEAMACGTPVAAFDRGALSEVVSGTATVGGVLARRDDVDDLARAVCEAARLDRTLVRLHAEATCSASTMVDRYEDLYAELVADRLAA